MTILEQTALPADKPAEPVESAIDAQHHVAKAGGKKAPFTHDLLEKAYGPRTSWTEKANGAQHATEELFKSFHR